MCTLLIIMPLQDKIIMARSFASARSTRKFILGIILTVFLVFYLYVTFPKYEAGNEPYKIPEKLFQREEQNWEVIPVEISERLERIKHVCRKYNLGKYKSEGEIPLFVHPPTPAYAVWYIDLKHQLSWLPIYKAASTSWMYNFALLGGLPEKYLKSTKEQISVVTRNVIPELSIEDTIQALATTFKFVIVRHPFERLLSAYRDKLENIRVGLEHGVEHYYKRFGRRIVEKFRNKSAVIPTSYDKSLQDPNLPPPVGIEPTFAEFVRYLNYIDVVEYSDDHWIPYYLHSTPCLVDFDFVAKLETLNLDQYYIIHKSNISDIVKPSWRHLTKGKKTNEVVQKYFSTLTRSELFKLYEKYRLDFELFDYKIDDYLKFAYI